MRPLGSSKLILVIAALITCVSMTGMIFGQKKNDQSEETTVVEAVPSTYPAVALALNASGKVTIRVTIKTNGAVDSVDVVEGPKVLHKSAKTAAARWVFNEARNEDRKMRTVDLHFIFSILPEGATSQELLPIFMPPYSVKIREARGRLDPLNSKTQGRAGESGVRPA